MSERPSPTPRPAIDAEQLSFELLHGAAFFRIPRHGPDDAVAMMSVREPLVCGEWSYDDSEIEEAHFGDEPRERPPLAAAPVASATPTPRRGSAPPAAAPVVTLAVPPAVPPAAPPVPAAPTPAAGPIVRSSADAVRRAFDAAPGDVSAALALVTQLERRGEGRDALVVLDRAGAAGADPFRIACARAGILGTLQRYAEAERALREAAAHDPTGAELLIQTGVLACRRARWKDAVDPLRAGVARAPESAVGHYHLGEALNQTNDAQGALAAYRRATELDPQFWRAHKGLGVVLDRLGRSAEAAEHHRRAREAQRR